MPSGEVSRITSKLMAKLESFLLDPLAVPKGWLILGAGITGLFLLLWLGQSERVLLWAQTLAGNWSPPSPPTAQLVQTTAAQPNVPPQFGAFEISLTGILGIVLNIGALGILAKTLLHVIKLQRRQAMQNVTLTTLVTMDKVALRNDIVTGLDELPDFPEALKIQVTKLVNEKFSSHLSPINKEQLEEVMRVGNVEGLVAQLNRLEVDRATGQLKID